MGIPDQDKPDYQCRQDMNAVENAAKAIRDAIGEVEKAMKDAWVGKPADNWRTDFNGRMSQLKGLFGTFPPEEDRLVKKARDDFNKSQHHGGI